jgi:L-fuculose-phosphate aldolase
MSAWQSEKQAVLDAARKMLEKGLVVGSSGNVSQRLPVAGGRDLIAITPSSRPYDTLTADDIQVIDFDGRHIEGSLAPSIETPLHIGIYRARRNVNAVIHHHSVHASAVAVAGLEIPSILEDQVAFLGGEITLAGHAESGSREQVDGIVAALGDRSGVLLANHGAVGTGRTMADAFTSCELIEKTARVYLLALAAGNVNRLSPPAVAALRAIYDSLNPVP